MWMGRISSNYEHKEAECHNKKVKSDYMQEGDQPVSQTDSKATVINVAHCTSE